MARQSSAILPTIPSVKITSHKSGETVPTGDLTISGISSDNSTTECQVFLDWNDLKPFQKAVATGPAGSSDYSTWTFTYAAPYHLISNGANELTSKLSCLDDQGYLAKWFTVNVTGTGIPTGNISQVAGTGPQENLTDNYQQTIFQSMNLSVPTDSEAETLIKDTPMSSSISDDELRVILRTFVNYLALQKTQLTPQEMRLVQIFPSLIEQPFTPERKLQLGMIVPYLVNSNTEIRSMVEALNLGKSFGDLSLEGKLSLVDLLIGLAAIYLSAISSGMLNAGDAVAVSRSVINKVSQTTSKSTFKANLYFVTFQVPADPCKSTTGYPQCQPHLIPIPLKSCFQGNTSKCVAIDPVRNIGFCNDKKQDCIDEDYVPPVAGPDGKWYYPPEPEPKPPACPPTENEVVVAISCEPPICHDGKLPNGDSCLENAPPPTGVIDDYCFNPSGCYKGNLPNGDCTPYDDGRNVCDELGNCDNDKWDCDDFSECDNGTYLPDCERPNYNGTVPYNSSRGCGETIGTGAADCGFFPEASFVYNPQNCAEGLYCDATLGNLSNGSGSEVTGSPPVGTEPGILGTVGSNGSEGEVTGSPPVGTEPGILGTVGSNGSEGEVTGSPPVGTEPSMGSLGTPPAGEGEGPGITPPAGEGEGTGITPPAGEGEGTGITPPAGEGEGTGITPPAGEGEGTGITPPDLTNLENQGEPPEQQEDDGNYCAKNDGGCDGIPDGSKPSWCSDLNGGCKNFIVCDENDCKYDKSLLPKETSGQDKEDTGDTSNEDTGDTSNEDTGDTSNEDTGDTSNEDTGDTSNEDTGDTRTS